MEKGTGEATDVVGEQTLMPLEAAGALQLGKAPEVVLIRVVIL